MIVFVFVKKRIFLDGQRLKAATVEVVSAEDDVRGHIRGVCVCVCVCVC